jgi:hypothetical protein
MFGNLDIYEMITVGALAYVGMRLVKSSNPSKVKTAGIIALILAGYGLLQADSAPTTFGGQSSPFAIGNFSVMEMAVTAATIYVGYTAFMAGMKTEAYITFGVAALELYGALYSGSSKSAF